VKASISKQSSQRRPEFLAGDLALDFLNTRMCAGKEIIDLLQTDADLLEWLGRAGCFVSKNAADGAARSLLHDARELRESIRILVEARKAGRRGDPSALNRFLMYADSHPQLVWKRSGPPSIDRVRNQESPKNILMPIAEAAAALLSAADFSLVKRCEGENCVLWFLDQTKSHHRRWCSTTVCGNRHKVAAYRKRRRDRPCSSV
jgi:predicted RNA-binding Zn ribbon-like protein